MTAGAGVMGHSELGKRPSSHYRGWSSLSGRFDLCGLNASTQGWVPLPFLVRGRTNQELTG